VRALIRYGADIAAADKRGRTLLHLSLRLCAWSEEILAGGCDINATDRKGRTPLHYLVMKMRVVKKTDDQICHVLEKSLHAHPFLNLRDKRGRTVLDCDKANGLKKTGYCFRNMALRLQMWRCLIIRIDTFQVLQVKAWTTGAVRS
jgi:ankyrin repeat protein